MAALRAYQRTGKLTGPGVLKPQSGLLGKRKVMTDREAGKVVLPFAETEKVTEVWRRWKFAAPEKAIRRYLEGRGERPGEADAPWSCGCVIGRDTGGETYGAYGSWCERHRGALDGRDEVEKVEVGG